MTDYILLLEDGSDFYLESGDTLILYTITITTGVVSVTFSVSRPTLTFSIKKPWVSFSAKKPTVEFEVR